MLSHLTRLLALLGPTLLALAPMGSTAAPAAVAASSATSYNSTLELQIVTLTNKRRAAAGCRALTANSYLRLAARRHTTKMAQQSSMSHRLSREASLGNRITAAGYTNWTIVAENIAAGFSSADAVVNAWMRSESHRRNLLNCRLKHIGVGVTYANGRYWWTQDFGRR